MHIKKFVQSLVLGLFILGGLITAPAALTNQSLAEVYNVGDPVRLAAAKPVAKKATKKKVVKKKVVPKVTCKNTRVKVARNKYKTVRKCTPIAAKTVAPAAKTTQSSSAPATVTYDGPKTYPKIFGGTFYPTFDWTVDDIEKQMAFLRANDIEWIRFVYIPYSDPEFGLSDRVIQAANKYSIHVVLVLEPDTKFTDDGTDYGQLGKSLGEEAAKRFGWFVDYYQLANEIGGTALKAGDGQEMDQYDSVKYSRVRDTIRGMEGRIEAIDPSSKTIVSNQWLHWGMLELLKRDQIYFDIIGWNWFPDGVDMDHVEYAPGKSIDMIAKLRGYGKEVWLTEFNRDHGSNGDYGDEHQANYIKERLDKYNNAGIFSAIFIHELFDKPTEAKDQDRHWGIISVNTSTRALNGKPALEKFASFIRDHR